MMTAEKNRLAISVDMDEWYQCRWATGSNNSMWKSTAQFFREYYGTDKPVGEIVPLVDIILKMLNERSIKATFFITGEIAEYYPDMLRKVSSQGHEIGCHNMFHKDYDCDECEVFRRDLNRAKSTIESIIGKEVIGYRAPNSVIHPYMIRELKAAGFTYDSSVTPTRPFKGKFSDSINSNRNPYELSEESFSKTGHSGLWELPWPVMPLIKTPAGSGITSRILGQAYTFVSLDSTLKNGDAVYYFHPYEIGKRPDLTDPNPYVRLFLRGVGDSYRKMVGSILDRYAGQICTCAEIINRHIEQREMEV